MPFKKGHPRYGGIKEGQKASKTIAKEEARKVFEEAQLKRWELISEKQSIAATEDQKAREFTINQVIGKAKETIEHQGLEFTFPDEN